MTLFRYLFFCLSIPLIAQERTVVINECMPNNTITAMDQDGEYNDWVELYNTSQSTIFLEGYFLSDRRSQPTKFKFPNVPIGANEYLIVWVDKDSTQAGLHTNFKLTASSEQLYLFNPDTNLVDYVHFFNMQEDESIARTIDGNGPFQVTNPTYNSSNGNHESGVVINEWMAWNADQDQDEYGEYNDWIELYNNSNQSINLNGYFLSNKANEATKYQFPNTIIGANQYLVLWADQDSLQGNYHLPFKLDSERDDIILSRPDTSTIDYFFHHNVDSNQTQARLPNGIGNIYSSTSTIDEHNQNLVFVTEKELDVLRIHPNPNSGLLRIEKITSTKEYLDLYSSQGQHVKTIILSGYTTVVDVSQNPSGLYYLKSNSRNMAPIIIK